mmetsp:Transcript_74540/g.188444  ORF Transcript_74540/g.188444 Transcript_74540/m.188444 type:complete len:326 (-) Transcript_74540:318-1295(-)
MLEGRRETPLTRPPRGARGLGHCRRVLRRSAEPQQLQGVDDVDGIGDVDQDEAHGLGLHGVPALVLDRSSEVREPEGEGPQSVDREALRDDVQGENDLLQHEHGEYDDGAREERAGLLELMADLHVRPAVRQVHESEEDAQACIHVVREPLHLELTVSFEVLWCRATGVQRHHGADRLDGVHVVDRLLLAVPSWDVISVARPRLGGIVNVDIFVVASAVVPGLALMPGEGNTEDFLQRLLLVRRQELPCFVKHALRRDGKPDKPCEHVRRRSVGTHRGVHREPERQPEEHVTAGNVEEAEAHQPAWWWRRVETDAPRTIDCCEDG